MAPSVLRTQEMNLQQLQPLIKALTMNVVVMEVEFEVQ